MELLVQVPMVAPRAELAGFLGLAYRRIPVLAIGNDVYCDSSLVASALERRFQPSEGHATLFPPRKGGGKADTGMIKAFAMSYGDRTLFPLASENMPYHKFKPDFVKDRSSWLGKQIDGEALLARQPEAKSTLSSHLTLLEDQLADGREWLMDTEGPSLADISVHFVYQWLQSKLFRTMTDLFDIQKFPSSIAWISRMSTYLDTRQKSHAAFEEMTGEEAAKITSSSTHEQQDVVGFDETEAGRLGIHMGDTVLITPQDSGKVPTVGKLTALNREEVVIQTKGSMGTIIHCHFPRLNFSITTSVKDSAKL